MPRQPPAGFEWMEKYLKAQDTKHHAVLQTQVWAESPVIGYFLRKAFCVRDCRDCSHSHTITGLSLSPSSPVRLSSIWGWGFTAADPAKCVQAQRCLTGLETTREERVSLDSRYHSAATSTDMSVVYGSHTIWRIALKESLPTES